MGQVGLHPPECGLGFARADRLYPPVRELLVIGLGPGIQLLPDEVRLEAGPVRALIFTLELGGVILVLLLRDLEHTSYHFPTSKLLTKLQNR